MTLFLRNKENETIVDIEIFTKSHDNGKKYVELRCVVIIDTYSDLLLKYRDSLKEDVQENTDVFISAFYNISELRGWLWETYFGGGLNDADDLQDVIKQVSSFLKGIAEKYDLAFVTD